MMYAPRERLTTDYPRADQIKLTGLVGKMLGGGRANLSVGSGSNTGAPVSHKQSPMETEADDQPSFTSLVALMKRVSSMRSNSATNTTARAPSQANTTAGASSQAGTVDRSRQGALDQEDGYETKVNSYPPTLTPERRLRDYPRGRPT